MWNLSTFHDTVMNPSVDRDDRLRSSTSQPLGGVYLAVEIKQFILSHGGCTAEDVEACFLKAEEENKIMVAPDDDGNRAVYKV